MVINISLASNLLTKEIGFVSQRHQKWLAKNNNYTISPYLAHDLFDHGEDETGKLEEEIMALGRHYFLTKNLKTTPLLYFSGFVEKILSGVSSRTVKNLENIDLYGLGKIRRFFQSTKKLISSEFKKSFHDDLCDCSLENCPEKTMNELYEKLEKYFASGYKDASVRYESLNRKRFWQLRCDVDTIARELSKNPPATYNFDLYVDLENYKVWTV